MELQILGTRGEVDKSLPRHRKHSGVLIDQTLLLDLGEKQYINLHPKWILITHLHPDHAYFIRCGSEEKLITDALVFAPEKTEKEKIRVLFKKTRLGPYRVTPIPTHHSKHVRSQGYLIEKNGRSILYTGDLVWIDKKYHPLFEKVDLVVTDGSFSREGGMIRKDKETNLLYGHAGIPNLIRLFRPYAKQILFIHFGTWFLKDVKAGRQKLLSLSQKYEIPILIGYDGQRIQLKPNLPPK